MRSKLYSITGEGRNWASKNLVVAFARRHALPELPGRLWIGGIVGYGLAPGRLGDVAQSRFGVAVVVRRDPSAVVLLGHWHPGSGSRATRRRLCMETVPSKNWSWPLPPMEKSVTTVGYSSPRSRPSTLAGLLPMLRGRSLKKHPAPARPRSGHRCSGIQPLLERRDHGVRAKPDAFEGVPSLRCMGELGVYFHPELGPVAQASPPCHTQAWAKVVLS